MLALPLNIQNQTQPQIPTTPTNPQLQNAPPNAPRNPNLPHHHQPPPNHRTRHPRTRHHAVDEQRGSTGLGGTTRKARSGGSGELDVFYLTGILFSLGGVGIAVGIRGGGG